MPDPTAFVAIRGSLRQAPRADVFSGAHDGATEATDAPVLVEHPELSHARAIELVDACWHGPREWCDWEDVPSTIRERFSKCESDAYLIVAWPSDDDAGGVRCASKNVRYPDDHVLISHACYTAWKVLRAYAAIEVPLTEEEIERRRQERGGRSLEEIWKSLGRV